MRYLPFTFALRYLFSKRSTNAVNVITLVSMIGMGVISMAMVLVLSVFNGFEGLTVSLYNTFNPDLRVTPEAGKVFTLTPQQEQQIRDLSDVEAFSRILEEKAALKYDDHEFIGTLKGVDDNFLEVASVDSAIIRGDFVLHEDSKNYAVVGAGVEGQLGVRIDDPFRRITVLIPSRKKSSSSLMPTQAFSRSEITPVGTFSIQMEFDSKYMFVPLHFMQDLLKYNNEISAIELRLQPDADPTEVAEALAGILGEGFNYKDRYQQNEFLYKIMRTEKWATYAILTLILAIAGFNIIGSLSMLVLEKTKDIAILKTMGADSGTIRAIFLLEGLLSSLLGSSVGIALALVVSWLQITYGLVPMPGSGSFVIDALPVVLKIEDLLLVAITVVSISLIASWLPAHRTANMGSLVEVE